MSVVSNPADFGKVAVLYGGDSGERAVSLNSGAAVHNALCERGVDALLFDTGERALDELGQLDVERVWNALHGGSGEDGTVRGALAMMGLPCTGSGVLGSALAMDKQRSKQVLAAFGIPVPQGIALQRGTPAPDGLSFPVFVKPASGGSSLGSTPVSEAAGLQAALDAAYAFDDVALVESLLTGDEYTVGVLQDTILPAIRIEVLSEFYDYEAKYVSESTRYVCPALDDGDALAARLATLARDSFSALDCSGWGRVDFMLDAQGNVVVLEVNTVPGMTSHSLVPCAAAAAGIDFATLCWRVLETSIAGQAQKEAAYG